MDIRTNIPLKNLTTMKLGGPARFFAEIHTPPELQELYQNAVSKQISVFVIGGGSNLVAQDAGYQGLVLRMRIPGFEILKDDIYSTVIKVGAGEAWDPIVAKTVQMNLSGIEALSAIPGTAGAAPVQNIGAYGQEISETLVSLEAYDTSNNTFVTLENSDCHFSYRYSIFRGEEEGRYIITSITLELSKNQPSPPFYDSLQAYLDEHAIKIITHQSVRDAVVDIRKEKLPDPAVKPSSGSFFKNTIVEQWKITDIQKTYPELKSYDMGDGKFKISTGWLIEKCGFKGQLIHGMRINEKNCLVLINESATGYSDLAEARDEIITKVRDTFQIQLEQEPLEIPAS
ncbi:MAG: UDP-N-acetylpyruvoylglucosamine reductase [Candidatus Saccharibacteria bacterium]|nr:UDP-N-acetylpyruvoylglucosamine reductase [Candidatus Saccharibacteria bacterium]